MRRRTARIQGTRASEAKQDRTCDFAIDSLDSASPYWWCLILSYCRHLNLREIENFPIGIDEQSRSAENPAGKIVRKTDDQLQAKQPAQGNPLLGHRPGGVRSVRPERPPNPS